MSQKVPHSAATRFYEDSPPAKRLKRSENEDSQSIGTSEDESREQSVGSFGDEIPDSEEDMDDDEDDATETSRRKTDLESTLPTISIDKAAIAEYEAMRANGQTESLDLQDRLDNRRWERGKSSIYVDAFNLALSTVLKEENHLFDEKEKEVFKQWDDLNYEAQYLYVRLFLRKTSAWHRIGDLRYFHDIADIPGAAKALQESRQLPSSVTEVQSYPGDPGGLEQPGGTELEGTFSFADASESYIHTLEEASTLLNLTELKVLAKNAKVQGKNKAELLVALRRMSQNQSGLGWVGLKRSDSERTVSSVSSGDNEEGSATDDPADEVNRDKHFLRKILRNTGSCVRLSLPTLKLFERVHLVFYRSTEWTEKSLTTIILARMSRRNFPDYIVSRSANIFPSRPYLLEFEAALRTQFKLDNLMEFSGAQAKNSLEQILAIFEEVYPRWKILLKEEQHKEDRIYEEGEGAYLRRFSPAWVYTRIVHKGTNALGRLKMYEREYSVTSELLDQKLFHAARRGSWYQRKALLEEHYMYSLQPPPGVTEVEQQKKHWKRVALQTCERGLQDSGCHVIFHHDLQKRINKLEKALRIPMREQHDFGHVLLSKPVEVSVSGIQIKKEYIQPAKVVRRSSTGQLIPVPEKRMSTKTIWVDELDGGGECSVENMCLSHYRSRGMKGYHSEGGIIRTLFAYLFFDILFLYIPNVFQTAYQTCPLDLHTDAFFPSRASEINHRLAAIANGAAADLIRAVDGAHREQRTCVIGLQWDFALADLVEIAECFGGAALAAVCKVMAQEYRTRGGGIPDLFLWDLAKRQVLFAEVKSENDRLSDTQRLWIHVLTAAGVRVELCNAVAREVRVVVC